MLNHTDRVSAKRKIHPDAARRPVLLAQFYTVIIDYISENQFPGSSRWLENFYIEMYYNVFRKWHLRNFQIFYIGSKLALKVPQDISNDWDS